jgi:hypothetical protein
MLVETLWDPITSVRMHRAIFGPDWVCCCFLNRKDVRLCFHNDISTDRHRIFTCTILAKFHLSGKFIRLSLE